MVRAVIREAAGLRNQAQHTWACESLSAPILLEGSPMLSGEQKRLPTGVTSFGFDGADSAGAGVGA